MENTSKLRELLGIGDDTTEGAWERRHSVFIEASFTYNRNTANISEAIDNAPLVNSRGNDRDSAPWKMLDDEGHTASTEGHSRAVLIVEVPTENGSVRARELLKLEGAIDGANGQHRNNCRVRVIRNVPEWFWEAEWGVNKKPELETAEK